MRTITQSGYIMLPVMFTLVLVATIAFMMNHEAGMGARSVRNDLEAVQARYVAEAGLQHAMWQTARQGCGPYTDITSQALANDSYTTSLTTDLGSTTSYPITVDQDTWIRSDQPATNSGGDSKLYIRYEGGITERPMYRYDLSSLPADAAILSATAWFYVSKEHPEGPVNIHRLTADWAEGDATWNSMGDKMGNSVLASIPAQPTAGVWVSVNLTAQVQAWVNGQPNYGITLNSTSEGTHGDYASIEASQKPYLTVIVGTAPSSPASLKSVGTLNNGISRSITRNDLSLTQQPSSFVEWQPGVASGKDAEIWDKKPDTNYGDVAETWVSSASNDTTRSLLRFNMSAIPAGARILEATLSLTRKSGSGADQPVSAHRIRSPWSEDSVTWNSRKTGTNWDTAGGDFDKTAVATTPVGPANQRYEWSITPLAQGWVDGSYPNYGVVLAAAIAGMPGEEFYTSDDADHTRRPNLSITYACECGQSCVVPQGFGKIAMVGNWIDFSPNPLDVSREEIIESWGYEVDIYDDDVLWLLDSSNYDAIYIPATASDSALVDQLKYEPIGIVYELEPQNNDLGMASSDASTVGTDINIINNSHYITLPFSAGPLTIKTAASRLSTISGTAAAGAQVLAETGGVSSLLMLDNGASLGGTGVGEFAAGRRVMLPVGMTSTDDWRHLNNNGRLIIQRAIEWAKGADSVSSPFIGHWMLDDAGGTQATDSSGRGNDGTLSGGPVWVAGTLGGALDFDGIDDRVLVADSPSLDITEAITLAAWVRPNKSGTQYVIRKAQFDSTDGYELSLSATGKVFFRLNQASNANTYRIDSTSSYPTDGSTWMHIAATYDGAVLRLYLDGVEEATLNATISIATNDTDLSIGAQVDGSRGIDGVIDDARLYAEALSASDIAELATKPLAPIAHWKLDETSGTNAVDSVGGHDGTVTGAVWTTGQIDGALAFDADNILVPHDDTLALSEAFTLMAWVNSDVFGSSYQTILQKGRTGTNQDYWFGTWQRELVLGFFTGGAFREVYTTGLNLQIDTWYQLAATFDNANDEIRLYVNGVEVLNSTTPYEPPASGDDLVIGRSQLGEYWRGRIDDIRIYDNILSGTQVADLYAEGGGEGGALDPPPEEGSCNGTFRDEFSVRSFGNNDGTLNWTGNWLEVGESDEAISGDIQIMNDQSNYQLRLKSKNNSLEREVDLSGASSAILSFDYRRQGLDNTNDYVLINISKDGGSYTEIGRINGSVKTDGSYLSFSQNIDSYISSNTKIKLQSSSKLGAADIIWFDNIQIQCGTL